MILNSNKINWKSLPTKLWRVPVCWVGLGWAAWVDTVPISIHNKVDLLRTVLLFPLEQPIVPTPRKQKKYTIVLLIFEVWEILQPSALSANRQDNRWVGSDKKSKLHTFINFFLWASSLEHTSIPVHTRALLLWLFFYR